MHDHFRYRGNLRAPSRLMDIRRKQGVLCTLCGVDPIGLGPHGLCIGCRHRYADQDGALYTTIVDIIKLWAGSPYAETMTKKEFIDKMWNGEV